MRTTSIALVLSSIAYALSIQCSVSQANAQYGMQQKKVVVRELTIATDEILNPRYIYRLEVNPNEEFSLLVEQPFYKGGWSVGSRAGQNHSPLTGPAGLDPEDSKSYLVHSINPAFPISALLVSVQKKDALPLGKIAPNRIVEAFSENTFVLASQKKFTVDEGTEYVYISINDYSLQVPYYADNFGSLRYSLVRKEKKKPEVAGPDRGKPTSSMGDGKGPKSVSKENERLHIENEELTVVEGKGK